MKTLKRLANRYFSRSALTYWAILAFDTVFVAIAAFLAYGVNHGLGEMLARPLALCFTVAAMLLCFIVSFRVFRTYYGVIRFSAFTDLQRISVAVVVAILLCFLELWLLKPFGWTVHFSFADMLLFALLVIGLLCSTRVAIKNLYENIVKGVGSRNAFILGVRSGGVALAKNIRSSADSPFKLAGFVTPDGEMDKHRLMGVRIWPFDDRLAEVMRRNRAQTLIVSPIAMNALRDNEELANSLIEKGISIMVVPKAREWDGKSDLRVSELHPLNVEDLLPREKIEVDMQAAARLINSNVVMITGGGRQHRFGDGTTDCNLRTEPTGAYRPGRDTDARYPSDDAQQLAGHRSRDHSGRYLRPADDGTHLRAVSSGVCVSRGSLQACADDGGQSL